MTWKQLETRRETGLWLSQIVMPAITFAATTLAIPEVRQAVAAKAKSIKESIENKIHKN